MRRIYNFLTVYSTEKAEIEEIMWVSRKDEDDLKAGDRIYEELTSLYPPTVVIVGRAIGGSDFILARSTSSNYIKEVEMLDLDFSSAYKRALSQFLEVHELWWLVE